MNLIKHLATHGVYLKAEQCTVFDNLRDAEPSTSTAAASVGLAAGQMEESPSPASLVVEITDDDNSSRSSLGKSCNLMPTANLAF